MKVRASGSGTMFLEIRSGVLQGCALSPVLFNYIIDLILGQAYFDYRQRCIAGAVYRRIVWSSTLLGGGISSSPAAFLFLILLKTESSSSLVKGPSLTSNCLAFFINSFFYYSVFFCIVFFHFLKFLITF